jgi:inhibitor of cysteine peptidase
MKLRCYLITLVFLVIVIVTAAGCQRGNGEGEIVIRPAPIHEISVNIAESFPPQVFIYIKGGLADSCTTFNELTWERSGNTINIEVTTQRPEDAICAQVYGYFEKNVALGSDFASGETYTVNVNDETTSFVMQ